MIRKRSGSERRAALGEIGGIAVLMARGLLDLRRRGRGSVVGICRSEWREDVSQPTERCTGYRLAYLGDACSEVGPDEEFKPLQLGLQNDQREVGLGIHRPRHFFDGFYLHWVRSALHLPLHL